MASPFDHREPAAKPGGPMEQRLRRRARERKSWIARTATSLMLFSLVLFAFIAVRRDRFHQSTQMDCLSAYVTVLNATLGRTGYLPADWNVQDVPRQKLSIDAIQYADDVTRNLALRRDEPTLIAWAPLLVMVFESDGRSVAVFEDGKVHVQWMKETDFQAWQAEQDAAIRDAMEELEQRPVRLPTR